MYFSNNLIKLYVFEAIKYSFNNVFGKHCFARNALTIIIYCEKSQKKNSFAISLKIILFGFMIKDMEAVLGS